ncbi:MAG: hypothetical protein H7A37_09955 [Chlamydiales bacterium]|nr:hypothetical protein [Chlamydiia bacterium]MCP5508600.1 hypothetical protein [Chlamydiales bacterium]
MTDKTLPGTPSRKLADGPNGWGTAAGGRLAILFRLFFDSLAGLSGSGFIDITSKVGTGFIHNLNFIIKVIIFIKRLYFNK